MRHQVIHNNKNRRKSKILFWLALVFSWLTFIFYFVLPITILFWVVVFAILCGENTKLKWFLLCFSSWTLIPIISFCIGFFSFFTGNATINTVGLVRPEFFNLDREKRIWYSNSGGCMVTGFEILTDSPNNFIVKLMYDLFGVQNGVYKGHYPDRNETKKIIESNSQEVNFTKGDLSFSFILNNKEYLLKDKNVRRNQFLVGDEVAKVAVVNDELIIFKPIILDNQNYIVTYLADLKTGVIFARYIDESNN